MLERMVGKIMGECHQVGGALLQLEDCKPILVCRKAELGIF